MGSDAVISHKRFIPSNFRPLTNKIADLTLAPTFISTTVIRQVQISHRPVFGKIPSEMSI